MDNLIHASLAGFTLGGSILSFVLAISQSWNLNNGYKSRPLALAMLASMVLLFYSWLDQLGLAAQLVALPLHVPAICLFGPAMYLFFRRQLPTQPMTQIRDWILFTPAMLALVWALLYPFDYHTDGQGGLQHVFSQFSSGQLSAQWLLMLTGSVLNEMLYVILVYSTIPGAAGTGWQSFWQGLKTDIHNVILALLFVFTFAITTTALVAILTHDRILLNLCAQGISLGVYGAIICHFRWPDFFMVMEERMLRALSDKKYAQSKLDDVDTGSIREKLRQLMEEEEIYADDNLNLADVARELQISPHQLSEYLNRLEGKSFPTFINGYRLEAAKRMLLEDREASILSIAYQAGFQSKTTFNVTWRRQMGMSPSEYRRRN